MNHTVNMCIPYLGFSGTQGSWYLFSALTKASYHRLNVESGILNPWSSHDFWWNNPSMCPWKAREKKTEKRVNHANLRYIYHCQGWATSIDTKANPSKKSVPSKEELLFKSTCVSEIWNYKFAHQHMYKHPLYCIPTYPARGCFLLKNQYASDFSIVHSLFMDRD